MTADWKNLVGTITSQLLNIGIDKKDQFGKTPLHTAAYKSNPQLVRELLSLGANPNAPDKFNSTALHLAAWKNVEDSHFEVTEILLKNGADLNAKDKQGQTPVCFALWRGNLRFVQLFLSFEADVSGLDEMWRTHLFSAAKSNKNWEVLQLLLDLGLRADHRSADGKTPLHYACDNENLNVKMVRCLLRGGADPDAHDNDLITPLIKLIQTAQKLGTYVMEQNLKLMVEHTNFTMVPTTKNVLDFCSEGRLNAVWMVILTHLAKLQSLGVPVHQEFLNTISKNDKYERYYESCLEELLRAKYTKIKGSWITFYNVLMDDRRKLKNYAGNSDLIDGFKTGLEKFTIYAIEMSEKMFKGIKRRELFNESSITLSDCLPIFNPNHLIVRDILDCILSKKNLSKFCEEN